MNSTKRRGSEAKGKLVGMCSSRTANTPAKRQQANRCHNKPYGTLFQRFTLNTSIGILIVFFMENPVWL